MSPSLRLVSASLVVLFVACGGSDEAPFPNADERAALESLHSMAPRPPPDSTNRVAEEPGAQALGAELFADPGFSACGTVSCQSCHGGAGLSVSTALAQGCGGKTGRNPPSVLNAGYASWFMWDGRADTLWSQAILPLTSPVEMVGSAALTRSRLESTYAAEYQAVFGEPPSATPDDALLANFGKAVAAYERTLTRTRAPFDDDVVRFLAAVDQGTAESDPAYLGLKTFVRKGQCVACHKGPELSDALFHNVGLADSSAGADGAAVGLAKMVDWTFNAAGPYSDDPAGLLANRVPNIREALAQDPATYLGAYRTPSLRNVSLTGPYMHTGSFATLADVVEFYNRGGDPDGSFPGQRTSSIAPLNLTAGEKAALVRLLESMTGAP